MKEQLKEALQRLFNKHRIVFWYDDKQELRDDFDAVELDGVEKVEICNNEFQLKYMLLREKPEQRFLLYKAGPEPKPETENWLLDVQLAEGEFRADQTALWLSDLGLSLDFTEIAQQHSEFFKATKRIEDLKKLDLSSNTASQIRLKMLAVSVNSEVRIDAVLETLLEELANDKDEHFKKVERFQLIDFLWERVQKLYSYTSTELSVKDFVLELFKSCYAMGTDGEIKMNAEGLVFLKRWKDSRRYENAFESHSEDCADYLDIEKDLADRNYLELVDIDYFEIIDRKILSDLVRNVQERTISPADCTNLVRRRRQSHWFRIYKHEYEAIEIAAQLLRAIETCELAMDSFADGISRYTESWYQVDQLYRQFVFHYQQAEHVTLLKALAEHVEGLYSNQFLLPLSHRWQEIVDETESWNPARVSQQSRFFKDYVQEYLNQKKKVCVIVSDGLRYEIGNELVGLIRQEDRYTAELSSMVTSLPSYTQLGMAALLPHSTLEIQHQKKGVVLVDEQNSAGTDNRKKILEAKLGPKVKATALQARDLLTMNGNERRELFREHDVVYVYQNIVDHTGDKMASEKKVFQAAEETLQELVKVVKRLTSANATNLLITSDHGFIYQDGVEESDFAADGANKVEADYRDRRFLLASKLDTHHGLKHYSADQLGLLGETEVLIPKSINRLRLQGSGFRYVHGGATLQEVVVPVLRINKGRSSDVHYVDVNIVKGSTSTISTGQLSVLLYQKDAVSEKLQERTLRVAIFAADGELLSDQQEFKFDFASDNPREREQKVQLVLSRAADSRNHQQVFLRLEEKISGTSKYQEYASETYTLKRSFTSDFD